MLDTFDIEKLAAIRREWQEAAGVDASLLDVKAPVGLLLIDVVEALSLAPHDQLTVLGYSLSAGLALEVQD
jgi:hypothetical protein